MLKIDEVDKTDRVNREYVIVSVDEFVETSWRGYRRHTYLDREELGGRVQIVNLNEPIRRAYGQRRYGRAGDADGFDETTIGDLAHLGRVLDRVLVNIRGL